MSEVAANYNFNITEVLASMEAEGFQSAEVEAVLLAAQDDAIWNALEGFDGKHGVGDEELVAAIGQNDTMVGAGKGIPVPIPVNPKDPHVIKIAEFAVKKYNKKAGTKLVFVEVVRGVKWNAPAGTFYGLMIKTKDNKGSYNDKALVVEAMGYKKLIWYKH